MNRIQASLFVSHLISVYLFCSCSLFFTTRYQHEFAQIILVEDEDSQDYIFNHINTPQYQINIDHIFILLNIHVAMKRKRQSREIKISNDGEIKIVKVKQRLSSLSFTILVGHPVLRGYWSQRRFLKDLVNWSNNAAYED
ncbi:hypothetical protein GQ457_12G008380 [Hibiscus cannabinus]